MDGIISRIRVRRLASWLLSCTIAPSPSGLVPLPPLGLKIHTKATIASAMLVVVAVPFDPVVFDGVCFVTSNHLRLVDRATQAEQYPNAQTQQNGADQTSNDNASEHAARDANVCVGGE